VIARGIRVSIADRREGIIPARVPVPTAQLRIP
jgi:hypothetical protein